MNKTHLEDTEDLCSLGWGVGMKEYWALQLQEMASPVQTCVPENNRYTKYVRKDC